MAGLDWIWYLDGKPCSHPASLLERFGSRPGADELPLWERANSVECAVGAAPGSAFLLVSRDRFNTLSKTGFHTITIVNPIETVTLKGYVFVRALSMFGQPGDAQSPMLVELQDRRAVIARSSINKAYNVRIPAPPNPSTVANRYYPESLNGQVPWTWQTMAADIWGMLTDAGAVPTIPAAPPITEPPDSLRFYGEKAWYALAAALATVGLTVSFDPVADTLAIVRPGADPALAGILTGLRKRLRQDFDPPQDINAGLVPQKIKIYFPKRAKYYGTERDTPRVGNWEADPGYEIELATGVAGGRGTSPFNGDLFALYDHTGALTNLAELTKRANDILTSVKSNLGLDRNVWIAGATAKLVPGPELTKVVWRDYGDNVGQITMAERRIPVAVAGSVIAERVPEFDSIKPIDLGRRSHPVYPRLMQAVEVFAAESPGQPVAKSIPVSGIIGAKPAFLHRGRVRLFRNGLEILEPCFLVVMKDFDTLLGNVTLRNHDVLHGRLSGTAKIGQEELPLYSVEDVEPTTTTIVFTMLTDRTRETIGGLSVGFANVVITDKVGAPAGEPVGSTVRVVFADERWLESVKGCKGIADYVYDPVKAAALGQANPWFWIVKDVQGLVQGFWAITDEDRTAGAPQQDVRVIVPVVQNVGHANDDYSVDAWGGQPTQGGGGGGGQCSGNAVWTSNTGGQGSWQLTTPCGTGCTSLQDPNELLFAPPPFTGDTFTSPCVSSGQTQTGRVLKVRYVAGTFPRMLKGALCYCTLDNDITNTSDNTTMIHYVVQSDQQTMAIGYYLTEDNCGVDFTLAASQAPLGFVVHDSWPFSQAPKLPLDILNREHGLIDDYWAAKWNNTIGRYEVWYMQGHNVDVAVNPRAEFDEQTNCTTIKVDTFQVNVHTCKRTVTVKTLFSFRSQLQKFVDALEFSKGQTGSSGSGQEQCDPILRLKWIQQDVLTLCTAATYGKDEIALSSKNVVVGFVEDQAGCLVPVYGELIVFGQCGDDFNGDAILCVAPFECPSGSGSGS